VLAGIGPSISPDRYEVGDAVIAAANAAYGDGPVLRHLDDGKALFDLWEANAVDLESAGVPRERIEISGVSTVGALDEFYSHRFETRDGVPHTGRFATVAMLGERK
jgi:copper oxidase (laccase) domain-containing protein